MARLRGPGGCPWDREQTFDSIKPYLLEETYEVMDAIDARDWAELAGELGDLMLQSVFFSQMASEQNLFSIENALDAINEKLIRRHPHIFGDETASTAGEVLNIWGKVKAEEKKQKGEAQAALLDSVPRALPALVEAQQLTTRAAHVGLPRCNRTISPTAPAPSASPDSACDVALGMRACLKRPRAPKGRRRRR